MPDPRLQQAPQGQPAPQGQRPPARQGADPMQQAAMEIKQMPRPDLEQLTMALIQELRAAKSQRQPQGGGMVGGR